MNYKALCFAAGTALALASCTNNAGYNTVGGGLAGGAAGCGIGAAFGVLGGPFAPATIPLACAFGAAVGGTEGAVAGAASTNPNNPSPGYPLGVAAAPPPPPPGYDPTPLQPQPSYGYP